MTYEVAVVGAGAIGWSCAWALAREGRSVAVLDPFPSSGASYTAAGMLAPVTEAAYGEDDVVAVARRSAECWPAFAAELESESGLGIGYSTSGTLLVGADASDRAHLEEIYAFHQMLGLDSELVGPSRARELEPLLAPANRGGLFVAGDAQVDNRRLLAALAAAARRAGVTELRSEVVGIERRDGKVTGIVTKDGSVACSAVVLAAGHRSITVFGAGEYSPPTRPVKGQILRLREPAATVPLRRTVRAVVSGFSVYVVPRGDGRIVLGATQEDVGVDDRVTVGGVYTLLRDALRIVPSLTEAEITDVRVGFRPGSPDNTPIVGPTPFPGVFVATGHHRNGLLYLPVTTAIVTAAFSGAPRPEWAAPLDPARFAGDS